ncbi:MAG TPA: bifunctional 5,10-methylenetetrahydrofolate dehydrogenase/5,10-methenyltetrahydrofolate cyclohydrolase [Candidatus Paceibacterota bacterium]|nr:bifunctional 5,10-methylenetetrahydrofolate dehydrogenase/5,10-methenyltetrahydrofolate cyclohydrolase [Candidatus Paceibacterota bacterium]
MSVQTDIIDGTGIAELWLRDIAVQVQALGVPLHLAAVCGGDDGGLKSFVRIKQRAAEKCGIRFSSYFIDADKEPQAEETLQWLATDAGVHGIFVELPLPPTWSTASMLSVIPAAKDVDCISPEAERSYYADETAIMPPAVAALERVLAVRGITPEGVSAAVIGQGKLVGKPLTHWLRANGARVSVIDIDTPGPAAISRDAGLVIAGAGVPGLVTADWVNTEATVVDFGYARKGDAYAGDVDAESVRGKVRALTPVPGGMGPLVVAATLQNLLTLAMK